MNTISWFPTIETAAYSPRLDKIVGFKQNGQAIDGSYVWQFMYADPVTFEITKTFQKYFKSLLCMESYLEYRYKGRSVLYHVVQITR